MDLELDKIANDIMQNKNILNETLPEIINNEQTSLTNDFDKKVGDAIDNQVDRRLNELNNNKTFQELSNRVTDKETEVQLKEKLLNSLSKEQQNELNEYLLQCEKEKLKYRKKKEKKLIKEEMKAEIQKRKIDALWERFGYLYNGNKTKFVPNKLNNKFKEVANFYDNSSTTFKKIIKTTFRIVFIIAFCYLFVKVGKDVFLWILKNVNINNIGGVL